MKKKNQIILTHFKILIDLKRLTDGGKDQRRQDPRVRSDLVNRSWCLTKNFRWTPTSYPRLTLEII